ncbi:Gar1/Naf1 RNA binding region-domain-containing protein [Coniella lustricola]|uniref:H/ACA ribonucleoprotein complex non-core subunit NAF1 n=1 Tax=Coniella lustricola TaxID=2025994 RepID=A0A2T3ABV7_9PEZI|nr:Gar1/Naf1 RNA binding region-domain-containing protein [Coniella lustricola]
MNSNIAIPGLGQLDNNNSNNPPTSDHESEQTQAPAAVETTTDAEMLNVDFERHDAQAVLDTNANAFEEIPTAENQACEPTAVSEQHDEPRVNEDGAENVNMQQDGHEAPATELNILDTAVSTQDSQMTGSEDHIAQSMDVSESQPPSPRVTDALEAALNGLLGPAETSTEVASKVDGKAQAENPQSQEQPPVISTANEGAAADHPEWEVDSSPYESSSDSSDDSSDDESDVEESKLGIEETARLLMEADGGSDDEIDGARAAKQAAGVRTKNEQPDEPAPKPDIVIQPEEPIVPLGIVQHIVEGTQVVIEGLQNGVAATIVDLGTPLCKEDRTVLGTVHDTIATVHKPMYILKFKNEDDVKTAGLERGSQIWYPKSLANFVFPAQLRQEKGSDASNLHDEEVGPDEMEYSDDEQEQAHKREKKNRKRGKGKPNKGGDNDKRGPNSNSNGDGNLRYDEDDDGPYKPLSRPANFGMGLPPMPTPGATGFSPAGNNHRGGPHQGRHGELGGRGRGGRGRGFNGRGRGGSGGGQGHNSHHNQPAAQPQNGYQPAVPFPTNQVPAPGQWPFPMPSMPQFTGIAPNAGYALPAWGGNQAAPFPFPPVPPPVGNWPNAAQQPQQPQQQQPPQQQQASYSPQTGGYNVPAPYPPHGAANGSAPAPNAYQYPNYYSGGQAQNGQSQHHWG